MRGSTKKKIESFVDELIRNSSEEERANKSKEQLMKEVKILWMTKGSVGKDFISKVVNGELN